MSALDDLYRGQNASWRTWQAQEREGRERGLSQGLVEQEQLQAEWGRRQADTERVQELLRDPAFARSLQAWLAPRPIREDGTFPPLPPSPLQQQPPTPPAPPAWKVAADQANAERDRGRRWRERVAKHPTWIDFRDGTVHERDPEQPPSWFE